MVPISRDSDVQQIADSRYEPEGYPTVVFATPTGEGLTDARSFSRRRRCTLVDDFRIV